MDHELHVLPDATAVALASAELIASKIRIAAADGPVAIALSGGRTPWEMLARLAREELPWSNARIYQVDERVAPDGDPDRNLTHIRAGLEAVAPPIIAMPVTDIDLEDACERYAKELPERFALVHLGLGPDGHTASLVPDDPVLDVTDRLVALTNAYQSHRRMTLTYPALARADELLWLVTGAEKRGPLAQLLAGDHSIPAGRVAAARSVILADEAAVTGSGG